VSHRSRLTDTRTATALLDEAAAIVEAEWMLLEQDEDLWREVADLFAEMPRPGPVRPAPGSRPPNCGGHGNRWPITRGAGTREAGHHCRYGLPSVPLRGPWWYLLKGYCRTGE
jgi:hypothetical protein